MPRELKLMALSLFLWGAGDALFFYVVPLYLEQLGATPAQIGGVFSLSSLALALSMIPAGALSDWWGRKEIMIAGWLAGTAMALFMGWAPDLRWFAIAFVAYWLTGFVNPAITSYVAAARGRLTPERALTVTTAAFAIGTVLSPAIGGRIAGQIGLRALFFIAAGIFFVSTIVTFLLKPQPVTRATQSGGRYRDLFADRRFLAFCALVFAVWFVMWLGYPLSANFLHDVRGLTVEQVGALGSLNALGSITLNLTLGRRHPRPALVVAQGVVMLYLFLLLQSKWFPWIALAYAARAAVFVSRTLAEAQAMRVIEPSRWGLASGALETVAWGGAIVAPLIGGRLYELQPAWPFQLSLALLPVTMILTYFFGNCSAANAGE